MNINTALDFFIGSCYIKGLSDHSIYNYEIFIKRFIKFTGNIDIKDLSYQFIFSYIESLYKQELSKATIGTYIRHLKVFLRYLENEKYIEKITDKIKVPRQPKKMIRVYSEKEIKQIFESIEYNVEWIRIRNCCIIALMLDSGLRLNEVCTLNFGDLNIKQNLLKVHGKGDKERLVPIGQFTRYYIKKYMYLLPSDFSMKDKAPLFYNRMGTRMTRNSVKLFVTKLSNKLKFNFSSHKLRHNFATNYCLDQYHASGQVDIYKLMILLGHEDIKTTRRYLHLANQIIIANTNVSHLDYIFSDNKTTPKID